MKPAFFGIGLSMMLALGACAAPFGEEADQGGTREESVKSAEQEAAVDALRSRVQEDFASAPSMRGHEIVVVVNSIKGDTSEIAIQAHIMKRSHLGVATELTEEDFSRVGGGLQINVASPYRADVTAIIVQGNDGTWSTLKTGLLGSRAVEAYVIGQTPDSFEGWTSSFRAGTTYGSKRSKL